MIAAHKLVLGSGGENYVPLAVSRLNALAKALDGRPGTQVLVVDGWKITVRVYDAKSGAIRIEGGGGEYHFLSAAPGAYVPQHAAISGDVVRVDYDKVEGKLRARPAGSSLRAPPDGEAWTVYPPAELYKPLRTDFQANGIPEHVFFPFRAPGSTDPLMLLDTWTCSHDYGPVRSAGINWLPDYDIEYDAPPTVYRSSQPGGAYVPDADWYKRAALRRVTHPKFGSRLFYLMTMASGHLAIWPTGLESGPQMIPDAYIAQAIKTTLPEGTTQYQMIPMPGWAHGFPGSMARDLYNPAEGDGGHIHHILPAPVWKFNSHATRMCSVAAQYLDPVQFPNTSFPAPRRMTVGLRTYNAGEPVPHPHAGQTLDLSRLLPAMPAGTPVQESLFGLVEFNIGIELTGPGPLDFAVNLSRVFEIVPMSHPRMVLAADYAMAIDGLQDDGDLITLEAEVLHSRTSWATRYSDYAVRYTIRNVSAARVLRTFLGDSQFITGDRPADFLAYTQQDRDSLDPFVGGTRVVLDHEVLRTNIAALDLRFCAVALEKRAIRKTSTPASDRTFVATERGAARIECWAWGALQEARDIPGSDPDMLARLDPLHAKDLDYLTRLEPSATGPAYGMPVIGSPMFLGDDLWNYAGHTTYAVEWSSYVAEHFNWGLGEGRWDSLDDPRWRTDPGVLQIPVGAVVYDNLARRNLTMTPWSRFILHADGHWALTTARTVFCVGTTKIPYTVAHDYPESTESIVKTANGIDRQISLANFAQDFFDIVSFRVAVPQPDRSVAYEDVRSTHLALRNEAYGLNLTREEHLYDLSIDAFPLAGGGRLHRLHIADKDRPEDVHGYLYLAQTVMGTRVLPGGIEEVEKWMRTWSPHYLELARRMKGISDLPEDTDIQMGANALGLGGMSKLFVRGDPDGAMPEDAFIRLRGSPVVLGGNALFAGSLGR